MSPCPVPSSPARRPPALRVALAGLILAGSGCTMIPRLQRPQAQVAAAFPGGSSAERGRTAADVSWREFFVENRLRRLIEIALANNLDLRVAMLNVDRNRAQYHIQRAGYFPAVSADGGFRRQGSDERTTSEWTASLGSTSYEIDFFGRVRSLNAQALQQYFASREGRRGAQILLVSQVAIEYCTQRQLEEQLVVARQTLSAVEKSHALNQITTDAGATSELDLRTSEAQVHTARVNILTFERQLWQSENALVLLLGRPMPAGLPAPLDFSARKILADIPAGLPSDLLQRRPDIMEAEHTLLAANANIGAARAAFFPSVTLTGSLGGTSAEFNNLFKSGTGLWSFAPQVNLPIFTGGRNAATLDAARISTRLEVANYQKTIQTAFREVADTLVVRGNFRRQIDELHALVKAQQRRYELADERYRQGEDSYLNVLAAQQGLYSAQQSLIQTRLDSLTNDITLYKALGGGWK